MCSLSGPPPLRCAPPHSASLIICFRRFCCPSILLCQPTLFLVFFLHPDVSTAVGCVLSYSSRSQPSLTPSSLSSFLLAAPLFPRSPAGQPPRPPSPLSSPKRQASRREPGASQAPQEPRNNRLMRATLPISPMYASVPSEGAGIFPFCGAVLRGMRRGVRDAKREL